MEKKPTKPESQEPKEESPEESPAGQIPVEAQPKPTEQEVRDKDIVPEGTVDKPQPPKPTEPKEEKKHKLTLAGKRSKPEEGSISLEYREKNLLTRSKKSVLRDVGITIEKSFWYRPFLILPDLSPYIGKYIEVIIPSEYTSNGNKAYCANHIWGNKIYTANSDMLCIAHYADAYRIDGAILQPWRALTLYLKVLPPREGYGIATVRGKTSRLTTTYRGCALEYVKTEELDFMNAHEEMKRLKSEMRSAHSSYFIKPRPIEASSVHVPQGKEIATGDLIMRGYRYTLDTFLGTGTLPSEGTPNNFDEHCLYLEAWVFVFELCKDRTEDTFRFSRVQVPIDEESMSKRVIPLEGDESIDILQKDFKWEDIIWHKDASLDIKESLIEGIKAFKYFPRTDYGFVPSIS